MNENMSRYWLHWIPIHDANPYIDFIKLLQPGAIKIVDPDVSHISRAYAVSPKSYFILRNHPLSEQKNDIYTNPVETGKRHAAEWNNNLNKYYADAAARGLPMPNRNKIVVLGGNELAIWEHMVPSVLYNVWFLDELRQKYNLTGGALNLNVGWPANTGKDTPPDWTPLQQVYEAVKRGNHYFMLHEYWDQRGPEPMWGWHAGRFTKMPWKDVKIIIGEAGIDSHVTDGTGNSGWQHFLKPEEYADQVHRYIKLASQDPRFCGACVFTDDYGSRDWKTFDSLEAHAAILQRDWKFEQKTPPKPSLRLRLPFVGKFNVTQKFGANPGFYDPFNGHTGVDWGMPEGTPIISVDNGIVTEVYDLSQWGKYIKIAHEWGESVYAHLSYQHAKIGQPVKGGEFIGRSGNTGRSTGPHLHLGIRLNPYSRKDGWDGYSDPMLVVDISWFTDKLETNIPVDVMPPAQPEKHVLKLSGRSVVEIETQDIVEIIINGGKHRIIIGS